MQLFGGIINGLEKGISYSAVRQKAIAQNITNTDTANYKSKDVTFKGVLEKETSSMSSIKTDARHYNFSKNDSQAYEIHTRNDSYQHNGNNVDTDKEMALLAENQLYNQALVERLNGKFKSLQNVIRGGR